MKNVSTCVLLACTVALFGCGADGNGNGGVSRIPTSLSLSPNTDLITINSSESYRVAVNYDTGTSEFVSTGVTWGSDAPTVATVDASGLVRGLTSGWATVFADYQGLRGTRRLRVLPDYQGRWEGDWVVTACRESGDWAGTCAESFPAGEIFGLTVVVNQTRDVVTGTTDFGDNLPGPVTGSIDDAGVLSVSGTYTIEVEGIRLELTVTDWKTMSENNQKMTGQMCVIFRVSGLLGSIEVDGQLNVVDKVSPQPLSVGAGAAGRRGLLHAVIRR